MEEQHPTADTPRNMTKKERVDAAVRNQPVDRPPGWIAQREHMDRDAGPRRQRPHQVGQRGDAPICRVGLVAGPDQADFEDGGLGTAD